MLAWIAAVALGQSGLFDEPSIVPRPDSVRMAPGLGFVLSGRVVINDSAFPLTEKYLRGLWASKVEFTDGSASKTVTLEKKDEVPAEGYQLHVDQKSIVIDASTEAGAFYAVQTVRQLIGAQGKEARPCDISDAPRFSWRGLMLDVSRHFYDKAYIKKLLDGMAVNKLNVFHWHLTDDGGWRLEIKKYPQLTRRGAFRSGDGKGWNQAALNFPENPAPGTTYGGFYTQDDVREIIAYAADRHITIVPEVEMPGHELAETSVFPELQCDVKDHQAPSNLCPGRDETFKTEFAILDEVCALFPSTFIHIGGDEVDKTDWARCPLCQKRMKEEGFKDVEQLQSYFIKKIDSYLAAKGKRLIGWDEILEGGLAPGAAVMSWRGIDGGIAAARQGKDVVMSPTSHCYFDYPYATTSTEKVYSFEPVPAELNDEEAKHVLGGQANEWTEMIPDTGKCEAMVYPRLGALAEAVWTSKSRRSWTNFSERFPAYVSLMASLGYEVMPDPVAFEESAALWHPGLKIPMPRVAKGMPWTLRMAEGREPLATSSMEVKSRDFAPSGPGQYRFAFVGTSGRVGTEALIDVVPPPPLAPPNLAAGLSLEWLLTEGNRVPEFANVPADQHAVVTAVDLSRAPRPEFYAFHFYGYIHCPRSGVYSFFLTSDDGSWLKLAGAKVIDNDGLHPPVTAKGTMRLDAGEYPIEVGYFQSGGAQSLKLEWAVPGASREEIPASALAHVGSSEAK